MPPPRPSILWGRTALRPSNDACGHRDPSGRAKASNAETESTEKRHRSQPQPRATPQLDGQDEVSGAFEQLGTPVARTSEQLAAQGAARASFSSKTSDLVNRIDRRSQRSDTTTFSFSKPDSRPSREEEAVVVIRSRASASEPKWLKIEAGRTRIVPANLMDGTMSKHFENSSSGLSRDGS